MQNPEDLVQKLDRSSFQPHPEIKQERSCPVVSTELTDRRRQVLKLFCSSVNRSVSYAHAHSEARINAGPHGRVCSRSRSVSQRTGCPLLLVRNSPSLSRLCDLFDFKFKSTPVTLIHLSPNLLLNGSPGPSRKKEGEEWNQGLPIF